MPHRDPEVRRAKGRARDKARYWTNREAILAKRRLRYGIEAEAVRAHRRAEYSAHSEVILAKQRARYVVNLDTYRAKGREIARRYRLRHPGETATKRRWRQSAAGRDSNRARRHARRARERSAAGRYTAQEWLALVEFWSGLCAYCGMRGPLEADHRIPLSRGGSNDISNILPACRSCNTSKATRTETEYRAVRNAEAA